MTRRADRTRWTRSVIAALALVLVTSALSVAPGAPSRRAEAVGPVHGDGRSFSTPAGSCWAIRQSFPRSPSGVYWLRTRSMPAPDRFYCEMSHDGGGWVLIGRGRNGWTFDQAGQGDPAALRERPAGPAAYPPAALDARVIDQLLDGGPVRGLVDGVRILRAARVSGRGNQSLTWRFHDLGAWSWAFDGGHRLRSATVDGVTWTGGNTRDSRTPVDGQVGPGPGAVNDARRWITSEVDGTDSDQQGFAFGRTVAGSRSPSARIWAPSDGAPYGIPFTRVLIRPRIPTPPATPIPNSGLPAVTGPTGLSPVTLPLLGGVVGERTEGDTEPLVNAPVLAIAQRGNTMFVGGKFAHTQRGAGAPLEPQSYLAAFDRATGAWIDTFRPRLDGPVWDMVVAPSGLVIAGQFTTVDGTPQAGLAVLDPVSGALRPGLVPSVRLVCRAEVECAERPLVRSLDLEGDRLYIGGNFSRVVDRVRSRHLTNVARIDTTTWLADPAWRPTVDLPVYDLDATPARVHLVGVFETLNGVGVPGSGVVDAQVGRNAPGHRPAVPTTTARDRQYPQSVLVVGSDVWQGGSEHNVQVYRGSDNTLLRGWITARRGGDSQAIATDGTQVAVGSHANAHIFTDTVAWPTLRGFSRVDQARWITVFDAATREHRRDFVPDVRTWNSEGAWEVFFDTAGCLWAGGDFRAGTPIDGERRYAAGFVKMCRRDSTAPTTPTDLRVTSSAGGRTLTWSPSTDDRTRTLRYEVLRHDRVVAVVNTTSWVDTSTDTTARYFVRALDPSGNRSATTPVAVPG